MTENKKDKKGISGGVLKWIAIITMLIDHVGAVVISRMAQLPQYDWQFWERIYSLFRSIGRVAFPLFLFLLAEGFLHTKSRKRYLGRLLLFAVLSEIPFNLAITGSLFSLAYQNVYWQLAIGLCVLWLIEGIEKRVGVVILREVLRILPLMGGMVLAEAASVDYGFYGVFSLFIIYITRAHRVNQAFFAGLSFLWEMPAPLAFLPVCFYNGKRGKGGKYAFYLFYPAHLLILYIIARAIGSPY